MIRPTCPEDTPALLEMARGTGVFKPHEIVALQEVFDDYYSTNQADGHRAHLLEQDGAPLGFVYYAPTPMTEGTWHLWWIAVTKATQAKGIGGELLAWVEADIRAAKGRLLIIETSGRPLYELTRRFYLKHGYDQEASVRDFYDEGDPLVIFRKKL